RYLIFFVVLVITARWLVELINPLPVMDFTRALFISNCIVAPINEEIVFRVAIFSALLSLFKISWFSVFFSAFIFSWAHNLNSFFQFSQIFVQGIIYGFFFLKTKSLPGCIFLHSIWNFFSFI